MAKHQIIYTSCMRGINGVNDGQQIFSYDKEFKESKNNEVKSLFTYQEPSLPSGVIMNEEIALTMPSAFSYRLLSFNSCAVTLNTYLGRDYMGSAGRFGNHLSHSIICDYEEFNVYPCELYNSSILRKNMKYEEVNNPNPPQYLLEPILEKGHTINSNNVVKFLRKDENIKYYKNMVYALLEFSKEKKRIIICDNPENIIMWIAALEYTLPLEIAKKINFTTYEFDPELSSAQICGVVSEGSRYDCFSYISSKRYFVFDFIKNETSSFKLSHSFFEFIDAAMSFSYGSLIEFNNFIIKDTLYRNIDEEYYNAYTLYELLRDGIADLSQESFTKAIDFADKYTSQHIKNKIVENLLSKAEVISNLDDSYSLNIIKYMIKLMNSLPDYHQNKVKEVVINKILNIFEDNKVEEKYFTEIYSDIDKLARKIELSIPAELMQDKNRIKLLNIISKGVELWKIYFLIRVISDYVKDKNLKEDELLPENLIGALYLNIIKLIYETKNNNVNEVIENILDNFNNNSVYLVNMTLNIEGFLNDLELDDKSKEHLWNYFYKSILNLSDSDINKVNKVLNEYERFEEMFKVYQVRIKNEKNMKRAKEIFKDTFNGWFERNHSYGNLYLIKVIKEYVEVYKNNALIDDEVLGYGKEILHISYELKIEDEYVDYILEKLIQHIPLERLQKENEKLVEEIVNYQCIIRKKAIKGKILLLYIAMELEKIQSPKDFSYVIDKIDKLSYKNSADLRNIDEKKLNLYLEWILSNIVKYNLKSDDFTRLFKLFTMSKKTSEYFIEYCCKNYFKSCKENKNYKPLSEFFKFMFENGTYEDKENAGNILCKLSKQKLEDLDKEMKEYYNKDYKAYNDWTQVYDIAKSTNPLLKNISALFRKKRK